MPDSGGRQNSGGGQGRGRGGFRPGPGGLCLCPSCGHRLPHQQGVPCFEVKCPQCGVAMTRER